MLSFTFCSSFLQSSPLSSRFQYTAWMGPTHLAPSHLTLRKHRINPFLPPKASQTTPPTTSASSHIQDNDLGAESSQFSIPLELWVSLPENSYFIQVCVRGGCGGVLTVQVGWMRVMHSVCVAAPTPSGCFSVFVQADAIITITLMRLILFGFSGILSSKQSKGGKNCHGNNAYMRIEPSASSFCFMLGHRAACLQISESFLL